jgi:cell division protein YceG involved in septum cleavage
LYPTQTDHLYFVVDATREDGAHRFSAKLRQHQSNVALYRLAQRQRNKPEK